MKITCERKLGSEERKDLEHRARLMHKLDLMSDWVGFGMLYRTTEKNEFHFIDQKYQSTTQIISD